LIDLSALDLLPGEETPDSFPENFVGLPIIEIHITSKILSVLHLIRWCSTFQALDYGKITA